MRDEWRFVNQPRLVHQVAHCAFCGNPHTGPALRLTSGATVCWRPCAQALGLVATTHKK